MNLEDICDVARHNRIKPYGLSKNEAIHMIQQQDGHTDCFATASDGRCGRTRCLWRRECFVAAKKVTRN